MQQSRARSINGKFNTSGRKKSLNKCHKSKYKISLFLKGLRAYNKHLHYNNGFKGKAVPEIVQYL